MAEEIAESAELTTVAAVVPALWLGSRLNDSDVVAGLERWQRRYGKWCVWVLLVDAAEVGLVRGGGERMWSGTGDVVSW
jgi:hypothetical protein